MEGKVDFLFGIVNHFPIVPSVCININSNGKFSFLNTVICYPVSDALSSSSSSFDAAAAAFTTISNQVTHLNCLRNLSK